MFEIRTSARLLRAWALWVSCLAFAVTLGTELPWGLRALAAALLWPLWRAGRRALGAGAPPALLAIREDGQWLWHPATGGVRYVRLAGVPRHLGALWWLPLGWAQATHWLLFDAALMEPAAFSALQCSVQLRNRSTGTEFGDASQANC